MDKIIDRVIVGILTLWLCIYNIINYKNPAYTVLIQSVVALITFILSRQKEIRNFILEIVFFLNWKNISYEIIVDISKENGNIEEIKSAYETNINSDITISNFKNKIYIVDSNQASTIIIRNISIHDDFDSGDDSNTIKIRVMLSNTHTYKQFKKNYELLSNEILGLLSNRYSYKFDNIYIKINKKNTEYKISSYFDYSNITEYKIVSSEIKLIKYGKIYIDINNEEGITLQTKEIHLTNKLLKETKSIIVK